MTQVNNTTELRKGKHLTFGEMSKIEGYKDVDFSNRKIANLLGRSPQTINNAIKAGTVTQKRQQKQNGKVYTYYDEVYLADAHYEAYINNRLNCGRRPKWVETDEFIEWADHKMLEDKWSPMWWFIKRRIYFLKPSFQALPPSIIGLIVALCALKILIC